MIIITTALLITLCSQNLELYSLPNGKQDAVVFQEKEEALLRRFTNATCDIIAVQELLGGEGSLNRLVTLLRLRTGIRYRGIYGAGSDNMQRTGFVLNSNKLKLLKVNKHQNIWLPKLSKKQRPRTMLRAPLEIQVVKRRGKGEVFTIFNIHFKSKHRAMDDPAKLLWEGNRVESAEYVRSIAENSKGVAIILGDRNSGRETATTDILKGRRRINSFLDRECFISKKGKAVCSSPPRKATFISALMKDRKVKQLGGTYIYKNRIEWLDDILIKKDKIHLVKIAGVVRKPEMASDHDMIVVRVMR